MRSILQCIALLSAMMLIASCDSSSSGGGGIVVNPPVPIDAAGGTVVKGIIDGAAVTATDATGATIGSGTVTAGSFLITYDAAAVNAGVTNPITITIAAGTPSTATTVCDFVSGNVDGTGNALDCETTTPGTFVAFGIAYPLPDGFTLVCVIPTATVGLIPTSACNASPASDLAATEAAAGGTVTSASALAANLAISGLIQAITGIDLGGVPVNEIATANIAATGGSTATAAQLAVAAFASAIVASQAPGESLAATIARFSASITIDANGNAVANGDDFAVIATAVSQALVTVNAQVPNAEISNAVTTSANFAATATALCAATATGETCTVLVTAPSAPLPNSTDPIDQTIVFVGKLSSAISGVLAVTGAEGSGADISLTEAFANELEAARLLSEDNATKALDNLDTSLRADADAIRDGEKTSPVVNVDTDTDGLAYTLTEDSPGFYTVTDVVSQWPKVITDVSDDVTVVVISGATASSTATGFTVPAVKLVSTRAGATLQTFDGSLTIVNGSAADTFDSIAFTGTIVGGTAGTDFTVSATFTDVDDSTTGNPDGTYTTTFTFTSPAAGDLSVTFGGPLGGAAQTFTITTGSTAISGTGTRTSAEGAAIATDVITFTDGTAVLTLTVTDSRVVSNDGIIGTFTVGTTTTASLSDAGMITYTDGSVQSLPAIIF